MTFAMREPELLVRVAGREEVAEDAVSFRLKAADSGDLPRWRHDAHTDTVLPNGLVPQYSLCGDVADRTGWQIAVLRRQAPRGPGVPCLIAPTSTVG